MARPQTKSEQSTPVIRDVGLTGLLVTFADRLSEPANRAALAFRAAVEAEGWEGVEETATSLTSVFLRFDPLVLDHDDLTARLTGLLAEDVWTAAPLPAGRTPLARADGAGRRSWPAVRRGREGRGPDPRRRSRRDRRPPACGC